MGLEWGHAPHLHPQVGNTIEFDLRIDSIGSRNENMGVGCHFGHLC